MKFVRSIEQGDPSSTKQNFIDIKLNISCCRYWLFDVWDCHDMSFPYWRIYWNKNHGGELKFKEEEIEMDPDHLYIVAPFTSFSSSFKKNHRFNTGIHVSGKKYTQSCVESDNALIHFFIHFNLGIPFDNVYPGIYKVKLSEHIRNNLNGITDNLILDDKYFDFTFHLKLQSLIKDALSKIGKDLWKAINTDERVMNVLRYIEMNINEKHSNAGLASLVNMAPNSFARLFKEEMNMTVQNFIHKRKITSACDIFELSGKNIEEVSQQLGFSNRYHFSRVFKKVTGTSPGAYMSTKFYK